jgi:hypothetical protein
VGPLDQGPDLITPRAEFLQRVVTRGTWLRRRDRLVHTGSSLLALAAVAGLVFAGLSRGEGREVVAPVVPAPTVTVTMTATAAPVAPRAVAPASSKPSFKCVRSFDPACGPVRWEPDLPPNKPMGPIRWVNEEEPSTFRATVGVAWDTQLEIYDEAAWVEWVEFGDGARATYRRPPDPCREPYGLWIDPDTEDVRFSRWGSDDIFWHSDVGVNVTTHTWARPGRYEVKVFARGGLRSMLGACIHLYERDSATRSVMVEVTGDESSPTPSPSPTLGLP